MEQIDVIEFEKNLKKQRLKRLIKNKQALSAALIGTAQIPTLIINDIAFFRSLGCLVLGFEIALLKKYWKRESLVEEKETIEMLRTTSTYQELQKEYESYIKDVATLIRGVGLKSAKEVVSYLQGLMELGYFSKQMQHQYKLFKYEKDYLEELIGAKVVTGTCVCRHMSSFFVDVLNELGYTAANISCTPNKDDDDPVKRIQRKNVILDHAVAGVVDKGEKFLYDPTNGNYIGLPQNFDFTEIESIHVAQYVTQDPNNKKYLLVCPHMRTLNFGRDKQAEVINRTRIATVSPYEVKYIREKIEKILQGNMHNQFAFFVSHEAQRRKIEELYQELLPYSEEPIKKHIIRK